MLEKLFEMKIKILFGLILVSILLFRKYSLFMFKKSNIHFQIHFVLAQSKLKQKSVLIDSINDFKELKKMLRTKNNVLILFVSNPKTSQSTIRALDEAAQSVKGEATVVFIDCSLK